MPRRPQLPRLPRLPRLPCLPPKLRRRRRQPKRPRHEAGGWLQDGLISGKPLPIWAPKGSGSGSVGFSKGALNKIYKREKGL